MDSNYSDELLNMVSTYCDNQSDEVLSEKLDKELLENPDSVKLYVEFLDMHASLSWLTSPSQTSFIDEIRGEDESLKDKTVLRRVFHQINSHGMLVLAASLLLLATSYWYGQPNGNVNSDDVASANGSMDRSLHLATEEEGIAHITGLIDCKLKDNRSISFGKGLKEGENITIDEGLVQLTFASGAKVIMQGPASFTPKSIMDAELAYGKVSAIVPELARGYTVTTPTAEIVDLGTEFALDVDELGATEVHVLDGDVVARGRYSNGELFGEAVHARKLDGLRFVSNHTEVERITAEPEKFARQITPKLSAAELPQLPVTEDLELWVAADLLVSRDEFNRVSSWRDVCIGDNQVANDACQFHGPNKPVWIEDTGNGQPGIRFNGTSTRLFTDLISTGDQVSIFVACAPSINGQNATRWGGQLFNFGGQAPTIELAVHHNQVVYSGLWAADAVGVELITGEVKSKRILAGPRYIFSYTYDMIEDKAELWVNGESQGIVPASLSPKIQGPRTIGGHGYHDYNKAFYNGDIFEVLLYDSALSYSDRALVTDYLYERYDIKE